ncbi:MAG TPA: hypothetical protein VMB73_10260 [Acetobacteraceae bacterium]|nr:hypothetical protein [Acetobacteraceae bacterium]
MFRRHPKARRLDTRRRRFAPVNLRDELRERAAEAVDRDEQLVPERAGIFGGRAESGRRAGQDGTRGPAARFVSDGLYGGQMGEIAGLPPVCMRSYGGGIVLCRRANGRIHAVSPGRGVIALQRRQPQTEAAIGPLPQCFVQCHAAAYVCINNADAVGSEASAGEAVTGFPDMAADREGEMPAMLDEVEDKRDKGGEGVKDCGSAGPGPR